MVEQFLHTTSEDLLVGLEKESVDAVVADPPFNVSELAEGEHVLGGFEDRRGFRRDMGKWDSKYNPVQFVLGAARVLRPGGWIIIKSGDRTIGLYRDLLSSDHSTTRAYLDFFLNQDVLSANEWTEAYRLLDRPRPVPLFEYKATVTWIKPNPPTRIRLTTYRSSCEWFCIAKRLDAEGNSVRPVSWNFLSQGGMKNQIQLPLCGGSERLYWHVVDPVMDEDGEVVGGTIVPCKSKKTCSICTEGKAMGLQDENLPLHLQRRHHPTQTPVAVWDWIFARHISDGLLVVDPYAGTCGTALAARKVGADWIGCDASWEFAQVAQMRLAGIWGLHVQTRKDEIQQLGLTSPNLE